MNGEQHLVFGASVGALVIAGGTSLGVEMSYTQIALAEGLVVLGSLAPDLDHQGSLAGRHFPFLSSALSRAFGHRGLTHDRDIAVALFLVGLGLYLFNKNFIVLSFSLGILTHLFLDGMNPMGNHKLLGRKKQKYPLAECNRSYTLPKALRFPCNSFRASLVTFLLSSVAVFFAMKIAIG